MVARRRQRGRLPARASRETPATRSRWPPGSALVENRQQGPQWNSPARVPTCQLLNNSVHVVFPARLEQPVAQPGRQVARAFVGLANGGEAFRVLLRRKLFHQLEIPAPN